MNRHAIMIVLVSVPLISFGQQQRQLYPYEAIGEVPGIVTVVQDREQIRAFIRQRGAVWDDFMERVNSACPHLLNGDMTPEQFALHLDTEDARADAAISAAYEQLRNRLSPVGRAELDVDAAQYFGYAIDYPSVERLSHDYDNVSRLYRHRCLNGFREVDEMSTGIATGPNSPALDPAANRQHPDATIRAVSP